MPCCPHSSWHISETCISRFVVSLQPRYVSGVTLCMVNSDVGKTLFHFRLLCAAHTCGITAVIAVATSRPVRSIFFVHVRMVSRNLCVRVPLSVRDAIVGFVCCQCFQSAWVVELFFSSRGEHSIRIAQIASLLYYLTSQVEVQVGSKVDGAEPCRHQEDAPRECDNLGEGDDGDSRCDALQDSTRCEEERGQVDPRHLLVPQQQPDLHQDQTRLHPLRPLVSGRMWLIRIVGPQAIRTWLPTCLVTKPIRKTFSCKISLVAARKHCSDAGPLSSWLQRDEVPSPRNLCALLRGTLPDRSICGQDQLRVHRFGS